MNHGVTELLELEDALNIIQFQSPSVGMVATHYINLPKAPCNLDLDAVLV